MKVNWLILCLIFWRPKTVKTTNKSIYLNIYLYILHCCNYSMSDLKLCEMGSNFVKECGINLDEKLH